ncbi:MAG: transglutaminase-like cysteine peptidase [Candidatus Sedimenticola sp. (ex Thyasira tokunagai)]
MEARGALPLLLLLTLMQPLIAGEDTVIGNGQGRLEVVSANLQLLPQWSGLLKRLVSDRQQLAACEADIDQCASHRWIAWLGKLHSLENLAADELLEQVNSYVNGFPPKSDRDNYQLEEYWASPLEFLERSGDDEDAAVMKYFMLREQGIPASSLRITQLKDSLENRIDTVLLYSSSAGGEQVLSSRRDLLLPLSQMRYSTPVYSVNEENYWLYIDP